MRTWRTPRTRSWGKGFRLPLLIYQTLQLIIKHLETLPCGGAILVVLATGFNGGRDNLGRDAAKVVFPPLLAVGDDQLMNVAIRSQINHLFKLAPYICGDCAAASYRGRFGYDSEVV